MPLIPPPRESEGMLMREGPTRHVSLYYVEEVPVYSSCAVFVTKGGCVLSNAASASTKIITRGFPFC